MKDNKNYCNDEKQTRGNGGCQGLYPDGRPYYTLNLYLKQRFGKRLQKLSLDGGMSCPNRDGTISYGGCVFCSAGGSGDFAADRRLSVTEQIAQAKAQVAGKAKTIQIHSGSEDFGGDLVEGSVKKSVSGTVNAPVYIAYFQAYTNTYGPIDYLEQIFTEAMKDPEVEVLSIATRPDCLGEEVCSLLDRLSQKKPIWVELGLQTMHGDTAKRINRGYELAVFEEAVRRLKMAGHTVIVHVILGLPGETREQMVETVQYLGKLGVDGIKLQLLHVLRGTKLADWYEEGQFEVLTKEEYFVIVADCLRVLPRDVVIHRITGDGPKDLLIAPLWSGHKKAVLNELHHYLKENHVVQGSKFP